MADDDDVPEELWDMLDNLGHSKNPTMTQAPVGGFQQSTAPRIPVTAQQAQHNSLPTWRPQHMQQLPVAPPTKPASLAQQLAGTGQFPPAPAIRFQPSINQATGLPRYTQQQHQPWQPRQQYGTSQWSANHQNGNQQAFQRPLQPLQQEMLDSAPAHAAVGLANQAVQAPTTADAGAAAAQLSMQPTQMLTPQQLQQEVARLRKDLDVQAGMTTQLRNKLHQAEQEKQQLQQRVQHQQYPSNSIAQHKTKELEKQAQNLQQQLDFLNQELSDAKRKASDKESKASEAENKLKQLQEELRKKEDHMLQLQFELDHEKQRAERLTANPAAAAAAAAAAGASGGGTGSYSRQSLNGLAGTANHAYGLGQQAQGFATPGSSGGRKRRLNTAGASAAAAAQSPYGSAGRLPGMPAASQQQLTPLQQHSMQMQQLLQGRPGARIPQQQQQGGLQQQDVQVPDDLAAVPVQEQQQQEDQQQPMLADQPKPPQQPAQASAELQQQQQQHAEEQHSGLISLLTRVQQLQVREASLSMLLWNTCKPALQQLLQPISAQISIQMSAISNSSIATAAAAAGDPAGPVSTADPQQIAVSSNLAALSAVQQQLQAVATNSSNSNTSDLLLQLLQLASVLFPAGGLGLGDYPNLNFCNNIGPSTQAVHSAAGSSSNSRWVLQQPASPTAAAAAAAVVGIAGGLAQQQQQQYLVFQAVDNPQIVHVLPLPLAIAVLQLVQGLVQHDSSCLHVMAAAVGAAQAPGSELLLQQDAFLQRGSRKAGVGMQADSTVAGVRPALPAATDPGNGRFSEKASSYSMRHSSRCSQGSAADAAAVSHWASVAAAAQSVLLIPHVSSSSSRRIWPGSRMQTDNHAAKGHKRTLFALLADACRSHASLQEPVGAALATLAGRLPATLRHLLLPAAADSNLVVQLLHSEGYQQRCQAVAFLQEVLLDTAVAAAFAAAVDSTSAAGAAGGNPCQDAAMVDTAGVDNLAQAVPLQQLQNRNISYTQRSSRAAAKAAVAAAFQEKPQQQQQQKGSAAAGTSDASDISSLPTQAVYDLLYGLLECISSGVGDLPRQPQSNTDNSSSSSGLISSTRTAEPYSSAAGSSVSSSGHAWGVFELQRRACAVVAEIMLTQQDVLLQVMLDGSFTSGFGLSQRLLALIDAACSAHGGDPFCTATPLQPRRPAAAAVADAAVISKVTGVRCAWWECLERVRLAHEAVLLLRALVAAVPPLGHAATADLCSNLTALRMVQTTRAKLSEWSDALVATAAATAAQGVPVPSTYTTAEAAGTAAAEAAPAGAAALPLAPWAWAFSSSCGCRDKHSGISTNRVGRSSGAVASSVSEQLIRSQRPLLQDSLQEISNAAASVHRRAIYHIS